MKLEFLDITHILYMGYLKISKIKKSKLYTSLIEFLYRKFFINSIYYDYI